MEKFWLRNEKQMLDWNNEPHNSMVFDYIQDNGCVGKEMHKTHDVIARDTMALVQG